MNDNYHQDFFAVKKVKFYVISSQITWKVRFSLAALVKGSPPSTHVVSSRVCLRHILASFEIAKLRLDVIAPGGSLYARIRP